MSASLYAGLSAAMGLPIDTDWATLVRPATQRKSPYVPQSPASVARVRRAIPEPHALPEPCRRPDDPRHFTRCVCGVRIQHLQVVYVHGDPGRNAIVGSCCVEQWGSHCDRCDAVHQNKADNYCTPCRLGGAYCEACPAADRVPATTPAGLCADCDVEVERLAAERREALERAAENERRRAKRLADGICVECGRVRVRPPYGTCFGCKFPAKCSTCGGPCAAAFKDCWGCKHRKP